MDKLADDQATRARDDANGDDQSTVYQDLRRRNERRLSLARMLEARRRRRIEAVMSTAGKRRFYPGG